MSDHDAQHVHHAIDYIEIPVASCADAKAFYGAAFGWTFNEYGPEYAGIKASGVDREIGGLRQVSGSKSRTNDGPLIVLFSNALDATVESVKKAGGTIVKEPFDFPGGRRFHLTDPSGNELAVWGKPRA